MPVTERLMKPGQFSVRLRPDAPQSAWDAVALLDHIVITPNRLLPIDGFSDANILAASIYTGVVKAKPSPVEISGAGPAEWLGTDEGLGDLLDAEVSNPAGTTLSTWITSLRPSSLSAGTVTNAGTTTLEAEYQWISRREALDHACRAMGAEWRVNPDFTLDAAAPGTLHANYTVPKAVITRKPEGTEGSLIGLQATDIVRGLDVAGYTTKVIVVGKTGDGAQFATGSATGAAVYKDGLNNNVVFERLVDAPAEPATTVTAYAQSVLNLYSSSRKSLKLSSRTFAATTKVRPGDRVYVFDTRSGLTDTANQIPWRGETITPVILRCKAITWPITRKMGVYGRRSGATPTYFDLSPFVEYEDGDTQWEVGTSIADPDQDPGQLGVAYLGANPAIAARAGQTATKFLAADVANSTVAYADVTGLSFPVVSGKSYRFRFHIVYDAALATTGSGWALNGPGGSNLFATSRYPTSATAQTINARVATYDAPAGANASSAATTANVAIIEGLILAGAAGNVIARFRSEVALSAITAKATFSYVEWTEI